MTASAVARIAIFCRFLCRAGRLRAAQRALCGVHRRARTGNECRVPRDPAHSSHRTAFHLTAPPDPDPTPTLAPAP